MVRSVLRRRKAQRRSAIRTARVGSASTERTAHTDATVCLNTALIGSEAKRRFAARPRGCP
jgi:hypothetical protein